MNGRRILPGIAAAGVMIAASAGTAPAVADRSVGSVGQAVAACAQPYEPWFSAITYPTSATVPDLGASIAIDAGPPDTDGDGKPDVIENADLTKVRIVRGDGTVTLRPGNKHSYIYLSSYGPQPGDLDGDGRDELIIGVDQQGEQYLLPGTVGTGTHDLPDVGIRFDGLSNSSRPVGDQDADGSNDLAFRAATPSGALGWAIYGGDDLLAPGAGGVVTAPPAISTYNGYNLTAAPLEAGATPTIITGFRYEATNVTVHAAPPIDLIAQHVLGEYTGGVGQLDVFSKDGQTFVSASASDRSGSSIAIWNLDDPCSRSEAQAPSPADPGAPTPAQPLTGSPDFTG